jgi:hypothetical protein
MKAPICGGKIPTDRSNDRELANHRENQVAKTEDLRGKPLKKIQGKNHGEGVIIHYNKQLLQ